MNKVKIYLAGKMSGLTFEQMNGWRVKASELLTLHNDNIHVENPCSFYNFELDPSTFSDKECKDFDLFLVENCDIVLVNLEHPDTIGTAIELELATRWHKPIIAFNGEKDKVHPWMKLCVTKWCATMEEAIEHILGFYVTNI